VNINHTLHIQLSSCEGAVIRALGLMERRGFSIRKCFVGEPDGAARDLEVTVSSSRSGDLLKRQLERLHDVLFVELKPVITTHPNTPGIRPITRRT
jgi:acetolactate synthase regulatory subunit